MSLENDELDEAFGPDTPKTEAPSGDEIEAAFAQEESKPPPDFSLKGYLTGWADLAQSAARGAVNRPAASLTGAGNVAINAMLGRSDPAADYRKGQQAERTAIDSGEGIVQPEQLRTEQGKQLAESISNAASYTGIPQAIGYISGKLGPEISDFAGSALSVLSTGVAKVFGLPEKAAVIGESGFGAKSAGAAQAAIDFSHASPELKAAFDAIPAGEVREEVVRNHLKADSLPVRMRLTEGQATGDPDIITDEMNNRGATKLSEDYNLQGKQLKENIQAIRDEVGPDVFSTNKVEHGDTLIQAYRNVDEPIVANIRAKYQALEEANGGQFPVDAPMLLANATNALHKKLLFEHAPDAVMNQLNRLASSNNMTFEQYEALRTNLATIARTATDGNERRAASTIRGAMEELPLQAGSEKLKPMADAARAAAKARADALESDPAYAAAVEGTVAPDKFVDKFVTGSNATRDNVAKMRAALINDKAALQTMSVATIDDLREAAGVDRAGNGKFGQARFNKRLESLDPKLPSLLDPTASEQIRNLGDVARLIKEQPEGSAVNNSGTLSGAIAQFGGQMAQGVANVKTGGLAGPIIEHIKGKYGEKALRDKRQKATEPLAGARKRDK